MRLKALAEIYTMHSSAQLCNLIFFCSKIAKNFAKILQNFGKLNNLFENVRNFLQNSNCVE